MAMNYLTSNPDFVQKSADARHINKTLIADFTFDSLEDQHRHKIFLPRNMTKVLAFHDRNRALDAETGSGRSYSLRRRGPFLGSGDLTGEAAIRERHMDAATVHDKSRQSADAVSNHGDAATLPKPDVESMSPACLKVKASRGVMDDSQREKRRSVRNRMARQHEDKNAHLYLDLTNIRKKLNFKESVPEGDDRPRKRTKREKITCHCHVTIWDNRESQREPIIRKSELCDVTTSDLGGASYMAEIQLQNPFIFKSSELKVPLNTPSGTCLGIGDKYFLEIKIIPTRAGVDWPPVPILGRSEGDQITGLGRMVAEKLQGALVARYLHLPQAPAPDVPLSVFFLHEGRTYRSKYGLETNATWRIGDTSVTKVKNEEGDMNLNLWTVDEEGRSFGQRDSVKIKSPQNERGSEANAKQTQATPPSVKMTFNIDAASAKGTKDFRKCTLKGLKCPACPRKVYTTVDELQFHFMTSHSKYKFVVEKEEFDPNSNELTSIAFKIVTPNVTKSRLQDRELRSKDRDLNWQAPAEALDVPAFVNGDQHWVSENWMEGQPKKAEPIIPVPTAVPDRIGLIRREQRGGYAPAQKGGFLPAEYVSEFRKPERKRFPNVRLHTMTMDKDTMYTSISHRKIPVDEEARSESDDEIDDSWFVQKSLEALDVAAEKQNWTDEQRLLRRKWNGHRLGEKLSHPRYLSDGLIRFARSEKTWLMNGSSERLATFSEFLDEFLQRRVINQEVIRDIWMILNDRDTETETETAGAKAKSTEAKDAVMEEVPPKAVTLAPLRQLSRQEQAEFWLQLPPYSCVICTKPVEEMGRRDVRCSEHECEAPGVWYHTSCVRCKRKDRLHWRCKLCEQRLAEAAAVSKSQKPVD